MAWDPDSDELEQPPVHYGCHEFRDDAERVIAGRAHPELARLYHAHLAFCRDCQRYHHRLETVYRRPPTTPKVQGFAREREFSAILERARASKQAQRASVPLGSAGVAVLALAAAVLALALLVPSIGEHLFGPPRADRIELAELSGPMGVMGAMTGYGDEVRIPDRHSIAHQSQSFGRVVGGSALLLDANGEPITGDSLTVGMRIETGDESLQLALVGRLLASFDPHTTAHWHTATPALLEIGLASGSLAIRYDRRPEDPILQVRTPSAVVRVLGTVFTVAVDRQGRTTVAVLRGKVEVLDPKDGRHLAEIEAGFRFDVDDATYRDVGRREVAAALPLNEQDELIVSVDVDGGLVFEEPLHALGQIPGTWTVPGLSDDPSQRTLDRVFEPQLDANSLTASVVKPTPTPTPTPAPALPVYQPGLPGITTNHAAPPIDRSLLADLADAERERKRTIERALERCRSLYADAETRFRAARCLSDFMKVHGRETEAVEGLLLLGTLRMDFAHDYQSATRNIEEFLRRAPRHPKAEEARYKLVLAAIDAGYIERGRKYARVYLLHYPDGQYVGRILQRFPELKSAL